MAEDFSSNKQPNQQPNADANNPNRSGGSGDQQMQQAGQGQSDQMDQADGASEQASRQQEQFDSGNEDSGNAGRRGQFRDQISEHMEVIGADGAHVGTVDHLDGDRIKLTKADSGEGSHAGHHHYVPLSQVSGVHGDQVRLASSGATAYAMEEEE